MKTIEQAVIDETWRRLNQLSPEDIQKRLEKFTREQPALLAYLLAGEEEYSTDEEKGELLFLGVFAYETFMASGLRPRRIHERVVESSDDANLAFLQKLEDAAEGGQVVAVADFMTDYNQLPLFKTIMKIAMAGSDESPELVNESASMYLHYLKTVIDALDK